MYFELLSIYTTEQLDYPYSPLSNDAAGHLVLFANWLDDGAAQHNVHLTALRSGLRWRFAIWLVSIGCRLAGIGGR